MEYTMNGKLAFYFFVEVNSALKHIRKYIPSNRNVINYVDTRLLASIWIVIPEKKWLAHSFAKNHIEFASIFWTLEISVVRIF